MLSETAKTRLTERFAAPMPESHKRRTVFWREEGGVPEWCGVAFTEPSPYVTITAVLSFVSDSGSSL